MSCISDFLRDRCVLVTGATGFLGKALVEKILRSCPEVEKIYMLVRPKHGQDVSSRFREYVKNSVFTRVQEEQPNFMSKLSVIEGDMTCPKLGISDADYKILIQNISFVFHTAATVKFNEPLKLAFHMNVQGTQKIIQLCLQLPKLKAFVHVSSAFSNSDKFDIKEKVYKLHMEPSEMEYFVSQHSDDYVNNFLGPKLIGNHPNTYTFTKAMGENVVIKEAAHLPTAIIRPSIVCSAWHEPYPGWVDNIHGVMGIFVYINIGLAGPSFHCYESLIADYIPVDIVVNTMIAAALDLCDNSAIPVYNCTSGSMKNAITWGHGLSHVIKYSREYPSKRVVFYPNLSTRKIRFINRIELFIFCFIPAVLYDLFLKFKGKQAKMVTKYNTVKKILLAYEYFNTHEFKFECKTMHLLLARLSDGDKERFPMDISTLDWKESTRDAMLGIRRFVLKDDIKTLQEARNKLKKLYWAHKFTQAIVYMLLFIGLVYSILLLGFYIFK